VVRERAEMGETVESVLRRLGAQPPEPGS
jgi:hypothetical protein